jgi:hypothetical protein
MADETTSDVRTQAFGKYGEDFYQNLVKTTAQVYGGKAVDAVKLSPDEELKLWLKPSSDAAVKVYELAARRGMPIEQADIHAQQANSLWAHGMKGQQIQIIQQAQQAGATPEQINDILKHEGLTDDQIFATCRRDAYNLGKQNGKNDPAEEVAYHQRMAEKAAAQQAPDMTYQSLQPTQEVRDVRLP